MVRKHTRHPVFPLLLSCLIALSPVTAIAQVEAGTESVPESTENKPAQTPASGLTDPAKSESVTATPKAEIITNQDLEEMKSPSASPSLGMEKKLEELAKQQAKQAEVQKKPEEVKTAAPKEEGTEKTAAKKSPSMKLFGRIEQISASGDVKMPVLKAMTAKLDPRGEKLQAKAEESKYTGTITRNFPTDFQGQWGGTMQVWNYHYSPLYLQRDRAEAVQSVKILKRGRKGSVNFNFYRDTRGQTALKPADVLVSVPMKDTYSYKQMMANSGNMQSQMVPFDKSFQQVMGNMEAPVVKINFGNFQTDGVMTTGISGNQSRQTLVKNVIRQLAPNVIEQQIITKNVSKVKGSNRINTGYADSVLRFKKLNSRQLYVLAASVNYTSKGKYLDKLIMYGTVDRGRMMQTDPMAGLNKMMGGMMNLQGLGNMFGMPTNGGSGSSSSPLAVPGGQGQQGLPPGFNPYDILKKLNQQGR